MLFGHPGEYLPPSQYFAVLLVLVPGYLLLYFAFNLYTSKRVQGRRLEFGNIVKANTIGLFLLVMILYFNKQMDFARSVIITFYFINIVVRCV